MSRYGSIQDFFEHIWFCFCLFDMFYKTYLHNMFELIFRAHLVDSRGLQVYGVYMPRENPAGCFMTATNRKKDPGDEIPSAPPGTLLIMPPHAGQEWGI